MGTNIPGADYEEDPVVARLTAETQARDARLQGQLHQAVDTNPDVYAGQRRVAEQLGYPDAVVQALPDLEKQAQVKRITQSVADAPVLKQKLADDASFAKLAHDDTSNLSQVEGALNYLGSSLKSGSLSLVGTGAKLLDAVNPFTLSESDAATLYKNNPKKLQDMQLNSPSMFLSHLANAMQDASTQTMDNISPAAKQQYGDLQYQTLDPSKAAYLHPIKMIGDALQSLPTTAATALTIYLTRGAAGEAEAQALAAGLSKEEAKTAAIAAAAKTATLVGAGSEGTVGYAQQAIQTAQQAAGVSDEDLAQSPKYQALLTEGYTPETAKAKLVADTAEQSGIAAGIIDAAVNAVGGHFLGKIIGEGSGVIKSAAKGAVNEGATEFVQSGGEQLAQNEATQRNLNPNQSLSAGVVENALQGLFVGGLTGGSMAGLHGVANRFEERSQAAQQAQQNHEALGQLDQLVANSQLRARDPATFQQFIASATEDGPVHDVYIDAQTLANSGIVEQLAQVSPAVRDQYNEAITTGGSVRIPFDEYTTAIAGTPLNQSLIDHVKLDPNGMTFAQSEQYHQTYQEEFNKQVDQALAAQHGDDNFKASAAEVKAQLKDQLNAVGHTSPAVNDAYATMASTYYAVRAAQMGVTPKELFDQHPLNITGERVAGDLLEQANKASALFEVAPDPHNQELSARWDALPVQQRFEISRNAATQIVPQVLDSLGTSGKIVEQTGGYQDATNPSLAVRVEDPSKVLDVAKTVGEVFSQDTVIAYSKTPQPGLDKTGVITIDLPTGTAFDDVKALYDKLREIEVDGKKLVGGHTTADGQMVLYNFSGISDDEYAALIEDKIGKHYVINKDSAYLAFPANGKDYSYDDNRPSGTTAPGQSPAQRQRSLDLRRQASQLVHDALSATDNGRTGRGDSTGTLAAEGTEQQRLIGLPETSPGPIKAIQDAAATYLKVAGLPNNPQTHYVRVDPERGARIADAFEAMQHAPNDPLVKEAYAAMIKETLAQYQAIKATGLKIEFIPAGENPYPEGPKQALTDMANGHLWVFPTSDGFGTTDLDVSDNPLLAPTDEYIGDRQLLANDVFRIVHDVFGHGKEGVGFGPNGEENAWQSHVRMYSPLAARAMTTETRGQNSWVNFGPHGEQNRADPVNTVYADQKVGLLPGWVSTEGLEPDVFNQGARGTFEPSSNTISLLKNADLSTFLHELGHAFLELDTAFTNRLLETGATSPGEQQVLRDMKAIMDWFRFDGDLPQQLAQWNALSINQKRGHHELFAEGFEAYLFEGKAPNLELQPVFQRFRAWLLNVYRQMQNYLTHASATLTPEVRGVFDRMLATTEQIKEAQQARGIAPLFQSADEAGMTPEEYARYQLGNVQSSQDAIANLEAKSLKDMTWTSRLKERTVARLNKDAAALRKEVRKQVADEVDQEPVYAAMRFLKRGETTGPEGDQVKAEEGHRLSIPALEELYPEGELANHPDWKRLGYGGYGMLAADGLHPDLVAQMFGFASGDDLVRVLLDAQPRNMVIDAMTDQRMLEQHGEVATPDAISKAADAAIHNDVRTRVIATELAGLQKALGSTFALTRLAKDYAVQLIGKTKVKDLRPNKFATDAARAGKAADAALRKGKRDEAVTQKRNQLVNHTTTKAAYEAAAEVQKIIQQFRKIATAKTDTLKNTRNMDLVNAARAVLAEYGVGPRAQNAREYIDLVKAYDPELYEALEPDIMQAQQNAKDIRELTIDELRALRDQVESLWYLSRREKQVEIDGKMVDRDQVVQQLSDRLDELGLPETVPGKGKAVTEAEKRGRYMRGLRAALRRVEAWVDRMDDGNIKGAFRNFIFTPISEAADLYRLDAAKHIAQFRDLLKSIEPSLKPGRIAAPELNYTFGYSKGDAGMSELLHAIAHTGNESNKRKLLLGRGWATELEDGTLDTSKWDRFMQRMINEGRVTKAHFDFVQGLWDLLEQTKPLAQKTHREVFGRYFAEVTADSFTNQFGTYRGGYVPAITDTFEVQDAAINAALEDVNAGNAYMFPAASRGFTKSRVEYNRPLALDLRLLPQHIDKVLLFAHMERHVRDVMRILRKTQGKLNRYDPVAYTDLLLPWLNRAAKQIVQTPSAGTAGKAMDKFLSTMRSRAGMATMFANLSNALQQITGFSITLLKVQPVHLRQAMGQYIKSPGDMAKGAAALSPFMADRLEGQTFHLRNEIEDMLLNPSKYEQVKNWTQKHAYILQTMFQNVVDTVSWTAAYNQGLANGLSEADAIREANAVVRETQGTLHPEDISAFETGSAWKRAFTQFASYFNMQANVLGTEFAKAAQESGFRKGAGRAFYVFLFGFLVPCWVSEAIVRGMRGGGGDGDDEYLDEWLSFIFGAPARNVTAMVPIAGPLAIRAAAGFTPQQYDDRMATAPAISALESAVNAPASVYKAMFEDGRIKPAIKDTLTLVSMLTGVPVNVLGKPLGYMADVEQGKVVPTSTADAVRGVISGAASADSKR